MKKIKHRKVKQIIYKCIYCEFERKVTAASYLAHLDMEHPELSNIDKDELIRDVQNKISRCDIGEKKRIEEKQVKRSRRIDLNEYKERLLNGLENVCLKDADLKAIESAKDLYELKEFINSNLKSQYKKELDEAGIDYYINLIKVKSESKTEQNKNLEFYDTTTASVKPIYTPMGNKK
ncbi:hypothetical protein ML462_15485 [Gramella lutea]|uniref:Uncharacterized protein n=1 Tax=Christiangramia lutea TaxID=1607951 RepID=A0A9X2AAJ7_9FLAO|nr:hypothetical protein [Christiangramia lutea]MCH4824575.1 hypothetical protein [Christiangramia lutea]